MSMYFQLRAIWFDPTVSPHVHDALRRAGYRDGEPRPRHNRHWANR